MLQGTTWLSIGLMLSKIIGALYIIPWARMIGEHFQLANSLYTLAYVPYALFIDIGTAGFPLAITKQISQLNAKGEYKASIHLFKNSLIIMSILGVISAAVFYFSADLLSAVSGITPTQFVSDNVRVLRSLAPALLIIPPMSLLRGFFQGFQQMTTPALSQIIDQFSRVAYMLIMTYYVIHIAHGSFIDAVVQSTFAAFIGASVSLIFLLFELYKERHYIFEKVKLGKNTLSISMKDSFFMVLQDSIPFVLISSGTSMMSFIDQLTYQHVVQNFSNFSQKHISITYSWFSANATKLVSIVGSLTMAVTSATIPTISRLYHQGNKKELAKATSDNLRLYAFIVIPASIGLFIVSNSMYRLFYSDANGGHILKTFAIGLIFTGLFSMFISTLQGMGKHHIAIKSLSILLLSKLTFNLLFIMLFKEQGPGFANIASTSLTLVYLWDEVYKATRFNRIILIKYMTIILQCTIIMAISSVIVYSLCNSFLPEFGALPNLIRVFLTAIVGGLAYIIASLKLKLADAIMPKQAKKLRRLLHL
nr:polysaccharide biosynthesis protein [Granulicatella sp. 19428wC4_WM01]